MSDLAALLVSFKADISGLTSGIDKAKQQISSVGQSATATAAKVASASGEMESSLQDVGDASEASADRVSSGFSSMAGGLLSIGAKLGQTVFGLKTLWDTAGGLANGLLAPAISAETVTSALTTLDGSVQAAHTEMSKLDAFAAKTPFKTLDIDNAAEQLQGFGFKASQVIPLLTSIGDALGSVGRNSPAELQSVVDVFGKIRVEGKLTGETMQELSDHGINAWQALSDATGKSIPALKDMVSRGLLPANDAIAALTTGIEKNPLYRGGMAKASATFSGLLSTVKSNFDQVLSSFASPIIKGLETELSGVAQIFASPGFKDFASGAGQMIVSVFDRVGALLSPLKTDLLDFGAQFHISFASLAPLLKPLESAFQSVSRIVGGQLSADFKTFSGIAKDLGKWWQSTMAPAISSAMPGFTKLASVIGGTVVPAFAKIWSVGQQVARQLLPPLTKAFEVVAPIVVKLGGFLADNLGKALQFIAPFAVQAAQEIGKFAGEIIDRVTPIVQGLWEKIQGFLDWIKPYWPAIWDGIKTTLTSVWDIMKGAIQIAWAIISGVIKIGLDLLSGNWKKVWDDIKGIFSGVWDGIKSIASGVWNSISGVFKSGINTIIGMINNFIGFVDGIGVDIGPVHIHPHIPKIPLLASGGFLEAGQVGIVGESGPELAIGGPGGTSILSNGASRGALSGSGHTTINLIIDGHTVATTIMPRVAEGMFNQIKMRGPVLQGA